MPVLPSAGQCPHAHYTAGHAHRMKHYRRAVREGEGLTLSYQSPSGGICVSDSLRDAGLHPPPSAPALVSIQAANPPSAGQKPAWQGPGDETAPKARGHLACAGLRMSSPFTHRSAKGNHPLVLSQRSSERLTLELNPIPVDSIKNIYKLGLDVLPQQAAATLASGVLAPGLGGKESPRCGALAPFGSPARD